MIHRFPSALILSWPSALPLTLQPGCNYTFQVGKGKREERGRGRRGGGERGGAGEEGEEGWGGGTGERCADIFYLSLLAGYYHHAAFFQRGSDGRLLTRPLDKLNID